MHYNKYSKGIKLNSRGTTSTQMKSKITESQMLQIVKNCDLLDFLNPIIKTFKNKLVSFNNFRIITFDSKFKYSIMRKSYYPLLIENLDLFKNTSIENYIIKSEIINGVPFIYDPNYIVKDSILYLIDEEIASGDPYVKNGMLCAEGFGCNDTMLLKTYGNFKFYQAKN